MRRLITLAALAACLSAAAAAIALLRAEAQRRAPARVETLEGGR